MFTVNGYMVPFPDFHKVESQLDIRATILCCTGEPKEVEETCRTNATDYWTVQHQGKKSLVGFINPKDALLTKLQFDTEHTDFTFEKPKWVRPVSLLLDCTPNYLNGLLAAARKNRHKLVTPRFLHFPVIYTMEDIETAIRRKAERKAQRLARAARADTRLHEIDTFKLLRAYRSCRFDYWREDVFIEGNSYRMGDVKAVLDTREHLGKK